ncbi:hypothetical protein PM02_11945 [Sulfitobacter mediterraneus]|uniref:Uncharacterized protein n=1 Tax=Sulfitobacter mediterraneus TaxID=83219 RepID=A0A061SPT4_9RHOB|nr:hypothetical protein PM02_11945 [Sulfitobacter mediterraneus]
MTLAEILFFPLFWRDALPWPGTRRSRRAIVGPPLGSAILMGAWGLEGVRALDCHKVPNCEGWSPNRGAPMALKILSGLCDAQAGAVI